MARNLSLTDAQQQATNERTMTGQEIKHRDERLFFENCLDVSNALIPLFQEFPSLCNKNAGVKSIISVTGSGWQREWLLNILMTIASKQKAFHMPTTLLMSMVYAYKYITVHEILEEYEKFVKCLFAGSYGMDARSKDIAQHLIRDLTDFEQLEKLVAITSKEVTALAVIRVLNKPLVNSP